MENSICLGLAGVVLLILVVILVEAWVSQQGFTGTTGIDTSDPPGERAPQGASRELPEYLEAQAGAQDTSSPPYTSPVPVLPPRPPEIVLQGCSPSSP